MDLNERHYIDGLGTFSPLRPVSLARTQVLLANYIAVECTRPERREAIAYARARLQRLATGAETIIARRPFE
jgi:hypothetical protein